MWLSLLTDEIRRDEESQGIKFILHKNKDSLPALSEIHAGTAAPQYNRLYNLE